MAFMGIFVIMIVLAVVALLAVAYVAFLAYSAVAALVSGICWGVMKSRNARYRDIPLTFFISYAAIVVILIGIVISGKLSFDSYADSVTDQYTLQYSDLGVYAEETEDEIDDTNCITLNGVKYYEPDSSSPLFYRGRELNEEHLTPIANVTDDTNMIFDVKNDAGVTILWYESHQYLTAEGLEIAEAYYRYLNAPQKMALCETSPNFGYEDTEFDTELFNRLYAEWQRIRNFEDEEVQVMGNAEEFYLVAFSPDNVAVRDIHISYKDGEVYFYKYHNKYPITDKEAHDALLPIAVEYCE